MGPIWKHADIQLCNLADGIQRSPKWIDRWRVNRRRLRRVIRDQTTLNQRRFFCQNSGACGSTYLVQLLRDNQVQRCFHEKSPDLNAIGVQHFDNPQSDNFLESLLRYTRWDVFFEANNRLFSLTQQLASAFPKAKFIHLFRDGRLAVESAMSKPDLETYLEHNLRFQGTLAGRKDDSPLVRFCHYWNNVNRRILDDMDQLNREPIYYLSLADLKAGNIAGLGRFMGVDLPTKTRPVVNEGRLGRDGRFAAFDDWKLSDQQRFWDICGETFSELNRRRDLCQLESDKLKVAG